MEMEFALFFSLSPKSVFRTQRNSGSRNHHSLRREDLQMMEKMMTTSLKGMGTLLR